MGKKKSEKEAFHCPVKQVFEAVDDLFDKQSAFYQHLTRSRIEFLKAARCFIDDRIARLEKRATGAGKKKMTKIKVE
jgi:hypothetical protein